MNKYNIYGFSGIIQLFLNLIRTKCFYPKCRIIRFPFDVRGKNFIDFGKGLTTGIGCRIEAFSQSKKKYTIIFGDNIQMNDYVHITAMESVKIGNNVLMASKIYISDCTHGFYSNCQQQSHPDTPPIQRQYNIMPVEIMDNVWLGESVSVLPGVTIGKGSIIGANSIVTKDIPEYVIAVGSPAKVIKKFNFVTLKWEII